MSLAVGVFGVPGVGKSTLLDDHVLSHPEDIHVGGSSIVKAIIAPHSTRELDGWPMDKQEAVRAESIRRLCALRQETQRFLLVAGHFSLRNRESGKLEAILTNADHEFFGALVLLDGNADAVMAQTVADSRKRHGQSLKNVEAHLSYERALAADTAELMGVPFLKITNPNKECRLHELSEFLRLIS